MKNYARLFTMFLVVLSTTVMAQRSTFETAMQETFVLLDSAKHEAELSVVAARFERIGLAESNRWEPFYYQAFTLILASYSSKDSKAKDDCLDKAQVCIDKAFELKGERSELLTLQGWLYQGRISVSPSRGMTYSAKAGEVLKQALEVNPENPRAHYLMGMNVYHTPKMFGGGSVKALPYFETAAKLFKIQRSLNLLPKWGLHSNERMIEVCKKES